MWTPLPRQEAFDGAGLPLDVTADIIGYLLAVEAENVDVRTDALLRVPPRWFAVIAAVVVDVLVKTQQSRDCGCSEMRLDPLLRGSAIPLAEPTLIASVPIAGAVSAAAQALPKRVELRVAVAPAGSPIAWPDLPSPLAKELVKAVGAIRKEGVALIRIQPATGRRRWVGRL